MSVAGVLPAADPHDARWQLWKADNRVSERRRVGRVRMAAGAMAFVLVVLWLTMVV